MSSILTSRRILEGRQVLLLEDDLLQAQDAESALRHAGARVLGPFARPVLAIETLLTHPVSCAILDIHIDGGIEFSVARELQRRRLPFLFMTCVNPAVVPPEFSEAPLLTKPFELGLLVLATRDLVRSLRLH